MELTSEQSALIHATRLAFQRSRTTPRQWLSRQETGRLDGRNAWRQAALNERDIFRERIAPGATKVNCHILVDGSGSMKSLSRALTKEEHADWMNNTFKREELRQSIPSRIQSAATVVATLTEALAKTHGVRLNVWMHNSAVYADGSDLSVYPVIRNNRGRERIAKMPGMAGEGNGDGYVIEWLTGVVRHEHRHDEVDLVIVVSDGLPSWRSDFAARHEGVPHDEQMMSFVKDATARAREAGIKVLSLAVSADMTGGNQVAMYGRDNVIPFVGDYQRLAADFGQVMGRTLADAAADKRRKHRR